ncbi:MAG: flagellar biosynthesis anti-sigma factor FlgM [Lachnospiraceae bacterium]|nr:flagellar biosynthesis anti-sigma factor FlgM [Lachnospiraceae bacterium]
MRIDAYNQINQLYGVGKSKKTGKTGYASSVSTMDQVSFSSIGKDMQIAKAALAKTPDVRQDKVDALKTAIQNGEYNVSNESFAEKLMSAYAERTMA